MNQADGTWAACPRETACSLARDQWKPDFTKRTSVHNWIETLDLYCSSQTEIGFLGTCLFAGILFAMAFVIPFSDKYGRKPLLIMNAVLGTITQGSFLFVNSLSSFYCLMFLMGVAAALNPCVGYVYIMEVVEKKHETTIITLS